MTETTKQTRNNINKEVSAELERLKESFSGYDEEYERKRLAHLKQLPGGEEMIEQVVRAQKAVFEGSVKPLSKEETTALMASASAKVVDFFKPEEGDEEVKHRRTLRMDLEDIFVKHNVKDEAGNYSLTTDGDAEVFFALTQYAEKQKRVEVKYKRDEQTKGK